MAWREGGNSSGKDEDVAAGPDLFSGAIFALQSGSRARPEPANLTIWPYRVANHRWSLLRDSGCDRTDGGWLSVDWNQHRTGALRRRGFCAVDPSGWHAASR